MTRNKHRNYSDMLCGSFIIEYFLYFVNIYTEIFLKKKGSDKLLIYDKVKSICEEKGMSVRQVEYAAGLKNGAISKWNESSPTIKSLKAVADVLKVKVDKLIS